MSYKILIIGILSLISLLQTHAQVTSNSNEVELPKFILGANAGFKFSPNGHTYGLLIDISKPFYMNKNGNILLSGGLQEDFQIQLEGGFEGASGSTIRNGLHLTFGSSFYFLKSKKLFFTIKLFGGWSYKSTNMGIDNEELDIHRSYSDSYHYFARGVFLQAGYAVKQNVVLSAFLKADLRRLTDGDGISEFPDLLYGIGVAKRF